MKRWIPKFVGIFAGLLLGWCAAGWVGNGWPIAAQTSFAQDHIDLAPQHAQTPQAPKHEPEHATPSQKGDVAMEHAEGREHTEHAEHKIDPAQINALKLVPQNSDIQFMPFVLWGIAGLFIAALLVGPFMKKTEPEPDAHHADDAHGHSH